MNNYKTWRVSFTDDCPDKLKHKIKKWEGKARGMNGKLTCGGIGIFTRIFR